MICLGLKNLLELKDETYKEGEGKVEEKARIFS